MAEAKLRADEFGPVFKQALLKRLNLAAQTSVPRHLIDDVLVREDLFGMLSDNLVMQIRAHVYGEKYSTISSTVDLPVPQGRWAMFLWAITPERWRPWLKRKLGIRRWQKTVGFEQCRTYPNFVPAPTFMGGEAGHAIVPIYEAPRWID